MKKVKFFGLSLLIAATFTSCKKDDENKGNTLTETINAKWEISAPNSVYASFEFNKDGNYIVVENRETGQEASTKSSAKTPLQSSLFQSKPFFQKAATRSSADESNLSPIHFGKYSIEGNKIILSGFGSIDIISITAEEFTFSFTLESGERGGYVAKKAPETIASSSRTDMFCRTWVLEKVTIDENAISDEVKALLIEEYGDNWKVELERLYANFTTGLTVLFSRAGTYLVLYVGERNGESGLAEWKWANQEETAIYYSWENWIDDWNDNLVQITELTNTTLNIQEEFATSHLVLSK